MPLHFPDELAAQPVGGKAAALALLNDTFPVPGWFVITPGPLPSSEEIDSAVGRIGGGPYAVRSSALGEDGAAHSHAGQFATFLDVNRMDIEKRVCGVRSSATAGHVARYRAEHGLSDTAEVAVVVQVMVAARAAGVAFSADPVRGRRRICTVCAVRGTGDKLVSGEVDGETWEIGRGGTVICLGEARVLARNQAQAVAALARRCAEHFGKPQDIEWAFDESGKLWLLQSRPITTLLHMPDPDDEMIIWDNSNIAESYSGVTLPLTFSFARNAYEHVYRQFCRLMAVPQDRLERADAVFAQMLGHVRGRVYYNLTSWYRVLALLPGFSINRAFMEQMMGVKEPMPDEMVSRIVAENRTGKMADALAVARTLGGLVRNHIALRRSVGEFRQRFDAALSDPEVPYTEMTGGELAASYRRLEAALLTRWDAPLVNDFFAMIYYGLLRGLCGKWVGDERGTLQNRLLQSDGDIISAEPARRIREMATIASAAPGIVSMLADATISNRRKLRAIASLHELQSAFDGYLEKFGDRCLGELKLESPTVKEDPSTLLQAIGSMALSPRDSAKRVSAAEPSWEGIKHPLKSHIFGWVLGQTRARLRDRENLRFERTRLFGRVRTLFKEMGRRLHADGQLDGADDVFYLEIGEVLAVYETTGTSGALAEIARVRREENVRYAGELAPPDRFQTRGPVHRTEKFEAIGPAIFPGGADWQGVGASPGVVRGRVRVVLDPRDARLEAGEILVAQQTDPGWVVLFSSASGLLVERGSLLSHSAIVSRELNLPCIVSLSGITRGLRTGEIVEMDGSSGAVRRVDDAH